MLYGKSDMVKNKILLLFAHPAIAKSRVNSVLIRNIRVMEGITFHSLYDEYPDFHIDVNREQGLLVEHDLILFHHPFYWYSAPAILKEWIDLVLEHGFAYGREGKALKGKSAMNVITTGGRREAYQKGGYNRFSIPEFLVPFRQTASLCSMHYLPPFVVHGTHLLSVEEIETAATDYEHALIHLRDGSVSIEEMQKHTYMNDIFSKKIMR